MRIPQIRERIIQIAHATHNQELESLANKLTRRSAVRKVGPKSRRMTLELKRDIINYAKANPDAAQTEIAHFFNVNPGRVSEALRGVRQ
nr:winged helix-turn-helix transcriptional regulator [Brucella anthropi]